MNLNEVDVGEDGNDDVLDDEEVPIAAGGTVAVLAISSDMDDVDDDEDDDEDKDDNDIIPDVDTDSDMGFCIEHAKIRASNRDISLCCAELAVPGILSFV